MDFNYSQEQQQLRDTLARYLQKEYGFERRRAILRSAEGWSREAWRQFADMGLLALGVPEAHGGFGGNAVDTLAVMEVLGRNLVLEPYLETLTCAGLIAQAGSAAQQAQILPAVASGELRLALAHFESGARYQLDHVETGAKAGGDGYVLDGAKAVVSYGAAADRLIVSAREASGVSLFLVDLKAKGVSLQGYATQDGRRAAELRLDGLKLSKDDRLGSAGGALPLLEHALDRVIAGLCAEAVGAMDALLELTGAYLKTRKQFGVPIGSFQALQHRMADMLMQTEQARSMACLAAAKVDDADALERRRVIAAAKSLVGRAARHVGQQAVQLHGGIGVTDELSVSHYFKRLTVINLSLGDADHHLGVFSDLLQAQAVTA